MLKIRLSRVGKKNKPHYRIVVCEHTKPIKGKFIEIVGSYDPHRGKEKGLEIKKERIDYWVGNGAQMSPTVASLVNPVAKKAPMKDEKKDKKEGKIEAKEKDQKKDKTKDEVKDKSAK